MKVSPTIQFLGFESKGRLVDLVVDFVVTKGSH